MSAPEDEAAIPRPIGVSHELAAASTTPPPRKRRLGKLELAIIAFLAFDLVVFAAWKLLTSDKTAEVATRDSASTDEALASAPEKASEDASNDAPPGEPEPQPNPESEPGTDPTKTAAEAELDAALAPHMPQPDSPGPVRPMGPALTDQDFREAMVAAREEIVGRCLDSRMRRTLKISLVVKPSGGVEYARVVGDLAETKLGKCVVKRVYNIMFPPTLKGGSHTYTLRLR